MELVDAFILCYAIGGHMYIPLLYGFKQTFYIMGREFKLISYILFLWGVITVLSLYVNNPLFYTILGLAYLFGSALHFTLKIKWSYEPFGASTYLLVGILDFLQSVCFLSLVAKF